MAVFSSLTVVGVYLLALELTGKVRWGCLAAAMFSLLPANYRTIGFVLMREDFSLPFYALHLALLARAARLRSPASMALCALPLVAAVASWHATGFVASLEMACLLAWYLRTGDSPFDVPRAWLAPAVALLLSLPVPLLRRTGFAFGLPARMALGLLAASALRRRGAGRPAAAAGALGTVAVATLLHAAFSPAGGDYGHVWELMSAKLRFLGELPSDPSLLPFEARMMWQGPFVTLPVSSWPHFFGSALLLSAPAFALAARDAVRGERPGPTLVAALAAAGLLCSWLVARVVPIPGMLLPVAAAAALARVRKEHLGAALMAAAVAAQAILFQRVVAQYRIPWYEPPSLTQEYRAAIAAIPSLVPEGEAILADPVVSTAILAHTRRPVVLQPKWEEAESRRRFREFVGAFYAGTPDALRSMMLGRYRTRFLLVDRYTLWEDVRYIAGIPPGQPCPAEGTAAAWFLAPDPVPVPGFRLVYESPPWIASRYNGLRSQLRLYEVVPR
jgi:hypothetical protein